MAKDKTVFELDGKFTFGKYKGDNVMDTISSDPSYVNWCMKNVEFFDLSDEAKKLLKENKPKPKRRNSEYASDPGNVKGAANQTMVDVFGGSGMDGGWGSSPFG